MTMISTFNTISQLKKLSTHETSCRISIPSGTELHTFGWYFTGFLTSSDLHVKHGALKDYFGNRKPDFGIGSLLSSHDQKYWIEICGNFFIYNFTLPQNKKQKFIKKTL